MRGTVCKYGDNINTDVIIPGKYTKTLDLSVLAAHVMEDLDPLFKDKVRPGDFVAGGRNFGCGSSREQAPVALKAAGVACVVAVSFARIFYRNAINVGLPLVECDTGGINDRDVLSFTLGDREMRNETTGRAIAVIPLPQIMVDILHAGGLAPYIRQHGNYPLR